MSIVPAVIITTAKKRIDMPEIITYSSGYETARQSFGFTDTAGFMYLDFTAEYEVALSKNPVISVDLLDSCHSFIRAIRDKISTKRSRMVTNDANCTNVRTRAHHHKIDVFSLEFSIVPYEVSQKAARRDPAKPSEDLRSPETLHPLRSSRWRIIVFSDRVVFM